MWPPPAATSRYAMVGINKQKARLALLYQNRAKFLWVGISLIVAGFFITLWQSTSSIDFGFRGNFVLALFLIPTSLIAIGFGIVAFHFWKQYKDYSKAFKRKKGFEA